MKVLLDTCIVIDFLQNREPFAKNAHALFQAIAVEECSGFISAKAVTDIYYIIHHITHSDEGSRLKLRQLLSIVEILDTKAQDIIAALDARGSDYEDDVMIETAISAHMDCIITRNIKDFSYASLPVYDPEQFLSLLKK